MSAAPDDLEAALDRLPDAIRRHVECVTALSVELASRFHLDVSKAETAARLHDISKAEGGPRLMALAQELGLPVTPIERAFPPFVHGPVGAEVLRYRYGFDDEEVLDAIRCHTMGRPRMTPLDKVLFLADKLDPAKRAKYPFMDAAIEAARTDLDQALLLFIDHQMKGFIDHRDFIHPAMIEARNELLLSKRR